MALTDPHEVPLVTELSVGVSPGTEASIMLQKATVRKFFYPLIWLQQNIMNVKCMHMRTITNTLAHKHLRTHTKLFRETLTDFASSTLESESMKKVFLVKQFLTE